MENVRNGKRFENSHDTFALGSKLIVEESPAETGAYHFVLVNYPEAVHSF
jgi:hypothetical protein